MRWIVRVFLGLMVVAIVSLGVMLAWPLTTSTTEMASINKPFDSVDFSRMPPQKRMKMRDGVEVAYRDYKSTPEQAVVLLLHGSSAHGQSLHPLAKALVQRGITSYVPDIRGHGNSGKRGDVSHAHQPSEDIADILKQMANLHAGVPLVLAGFSSGGGLALQAAGRGHANGISKLLLLAPMLGPRSAPYLKRNKYRSQQKWAHPNIPRIIALSILNRFGIHALDHLPTISFATGGLKILTSQYSHRLLQSMNPVNAAQLLSNTLSPLALLVGEEDELFAATEYEGVVRPVKANADVRILPKLGHIDLTLKPKAFSAIAHVILQSK